MSLITPSTQLLAGLVASQWGPPFQENSRNVGHPDFARWGLKPRPQPDGAVAFFFPRTLWDHTGACGTISLSSVSCRDLRQACTDEKGPSASDGCRGLKDNRGKRRQCSLSHKANA
jgi:hypothetical protein